MYSPTQTNTQFFQQNLPHQVCFVPQLTTIPELQQVVPTVVAHLMLDVQSKAQQFAPRIFFFNMVSENWYQNPVFHSLAQLTIDMVDLFMQTRNMPLQQAVSEAVRQATQISMAARVLQNVQMLQPYIPPQVLQDFQALVGEGRQLAGEIENFKMRRTVPMQHQYAASYNNGVPVQPMSQYPGYPQPYLQTQPAGASRPSAFSASNNQPHPYQAAVTAAPVTIQPVSDAALSRPGRYDMRGIEDAPVQPVSPQQMVQQMLNAAPLKVQPAPAPAQPTAPPTQARWGVRPSQDSSTPAAAPVTAPAPQPQPQSLHEDLRPLDYVVGDDGTELVPAHLVAGEAGWAVSFTVEKPYRLAYDPAKTMLVLQRTLDGTVSEILIPWSSEMDYLKHELRPELVEQEKQRRAAGSPVEKRFTWNAVAALKPVEGRATSQLPKGTDIATIAPSSEDIPVFTPKAGEVRLVTTIVQGLQDADQRLRVEGRGGLEKESIELYFDLPEMLVLPDDPALIEVIGTLGDLPDFSSLHDALLQQKEDLEDATFAQLDNRATCVLNDALRDGLNLTEWSVDSFIGDWFELRDLLVKTYGDEKIEQLNLAAPRLISSAFRVLPRDETDRYVASLGVAVSELEDTATDTLPETPAAGEETQEETTSDEVTENEYTFPNVVVLATRVSVTTVPVTREEISLDLTTGALVSEEILPQLHGGLSAILKRTDDYPVTYAHRYLRTRDRKFIEIVRGIANPDAILLYDRESVDE